MLYEPVTWSAVLHLAMKTRTLALTLALLFVQGCLGKDGAIRLSTPLAVIAVIGALLLSMVILLAVVSYVVKKMQEKSSVDLPGGKQENTENV